MQTIGQTCPAWVIAVFGATISAAVLAGPSATGSDDLQLLAEMISVRETAMIEADLETAMSQFADDATWINSQGYFFEGKQSVLEFHQMLAEDNPLAYRYEAGTPRIRLNDDANAIVYYGWKMDWYERGQPANLVKEEIGLMTLAAQKRKGRWYWIAVTNQHTPWFVDVIRPESVEHH